MKSVKLRTGRRENPVTVMLVFLSILDIKNSYGSRILYELARMCRDENYVSPQIGQLRELGMIRHDRTQVNESLKKIVIAATDGNYENFRIVSPV